MEPHLPPGLSFDTATGVITGTPTFVTSAYKTVSARNSAGATTVGLTITIAPGSELYDPVMGTFAPAGNLTTARIGHSATRLLSGEVLIAGGRDWTPNGRDPASAELFKPTTGTFTPTGNLATARSGHTATLLLNGKVLIFGGNSSISTAIGPAELYDPATGTFTPTGNLKTWRSGHTATLLLSGKVLIAGCFRSSAELYDPATGTFTPTGDLTTGRCGHSATLLLSGKVLIAGGAEWRSGSPAGLASAELYDPDTGTFTPTGSLTTARYQGRSATLLPSGKVLIAGGEDLDTYFPTTATELYDPTTGMFTPTMGDLATDRVNHTATLLPTGKVLIAGGYTGGMWGTTPCRGMTELYDPATERSTFTGSLLAGRMVHTATLLPSGKVLIAGGAPWFLGGGAGHFPPQPPPLPPPAPPTPWAEPATDPDR